MKSDFNDGDNRYSDNGEQLKHSVAYCLSNGSNSSIEKNNFSSNLNNDIKKLKSCVQDNIKCESFRESEPNNSQNNFNDIKIIEPIFGVDYIIKNWFWYYLFVFGASLGYEPFYATFFPFWFWNINETVGRKIIFLWVFIMFVGQILKDILKWPRPISPPVVILEPNYSLEYGMPSTHAMAAISIPFSIIVFTVHTYNYPVFLGILFASFWCILICGSRLYLGMHSVLDIVVGLILATVLMILLLPFVDTLDKLYLTNQYSPLLLTALIILSAYYYPKGDRWSPSKGDVFTVMGAGCGILIGSWLNYQLGIINVTSLKPSFSLIWPGFNVLGLTLLRMTLGILCILGVRSAAKVFSFSLVCYINQVDSNDPYTQFLSYVEIPYKLITYILMGISITFLSPLIFRLLGIEKTTVFTET